jgi:hypothetical protein
MNMPASENIIIAPNRLIIGETRVSRCPEPQTQPQVQPGGERVVVSLPRNWSRHHPDGNLAAASPAKEVSLRVNTYRFDASSDINLTVFAKYHYSFANESFNRSGNERKFSISVVEVVVRDFIHPIHGLNRVIGCVQVNEKKNLFVCLHFFSKVSSVTEYRQAMDRIITSVRIEKTT